jgi:hypothetical protein
MSVMRQRVNDKARCRYRIGGAPTLHCGAGPWADQRRRQVVGDDGAGAGDGPLLLTTYVVVEPGTADVRPSVLSDEVATLSICVESVATVLPGSGSVGTGRRSMLAVLMIVPLAPVTVALT